MKNLEQIRAKNALNMKIGTGAGGGESVAKKVPAMILDNGIIAAAAFAKETGEGYKNVFEAIIWHLADPQIAYLDDREMKLDEFIEHLVKENSDRIRLITAETMAYLNYLRRFA